MKRILHYKRGVFLPLTETWIYSQIRGASEFDPVVYCQGRRNVDAFPLPRIRNLELPPMRLHPLAFRVLNRIFSDAALALFLVRDRPDLVHAHFGPSGYAFLWARRGFRIPLITTFYGFDISRLPQSSPPWRRRYRKLFREGDLFLVEGGFMRQTLIGLGCPENKVLVQTLGADLDKIPFAARHWNRGEPLKVLISGTFREKKGIPYALAALGLFRDRFAPELLQVTVIGQSTGSTQDEAEALKIAAVVAQYGLHDIVTFLGYQPHSVFLEQLYKHHIFLSPSVTAADGDTEGGAPVSIIEASASGMPIVSTRHCDIPEVVLDGETGWLAPERDATALAVLLGRLAADEVAMAAMGRKGRAHVEACYDLSVQTRRLGAIYRSLLP